MMKHMLDCGLSVEKQVLRDMFAHMAASKLLMIEFMNEQLRERFVELFSDFIGAKYQSHAIENNDFILTSQKIQHLISQSEQEPELIHFIAIKGLKMNDTKHRLMDLYKYAINPQLPLNIVNDGQNIQMHIPSNLWFVIIPKDETQLVLSDIMSKSVAVVALKAKSSTPKDNIIMNDLKLSYNNWKNIIIEGCDQYYLDEEDWKQIDDVEHYFQKITEFSIDNRLFRQYERYTSTYLMFGGEKKEAIDNLLYARLLRNPLIEKKTKIQSSIEDVLLLFDRLFGLENLSKSKVLIKELQKIYQLQETRF